MFITGGRQAMASMWEPWYNLWGSFLSFHHVGQGNLSQVKYLHPFTHQATSLPHLPPKDTVFKTNFIHPVWKAASPYYSYLVLAANALGWTLESVCQNAVVPATILTNWAFGRKWGGFHCLRPVYSLSSTKKPVKKCVPNKTSLLSFHRNLRVENIMSQQGVGGAPP